MLQRRHHILRRLHNLFDAGLTATIFLLTYLLRNHLASVGSLEELGRLLPFGHYAPLMLLAGLLWPVVLNYHGLYDSTRLRKAYVDVGIIFRSSMESTVILVLIIFLFQMETVSRLFLIGFGFFNAFALVVKDLVRRQYGLRRRLKARDIRRVLVVGNPERVGEVIQKISNEDYLGLRIVGVVLTTQEAPVEVIGGIPVVGFLEKWREILHSHPVANVIFTTPQENLKEVEKALSICQEEGVEAWVLAPLFGLNFSRVALDYFSNVPILVFRTRPVLSWPYIFKLILDRLLALASFILLSPFFLLIGLGIWLTSGRPIFYKQSRVGQFGQIFQLYKFRTFGAGDAKPTTIGRWLRLSSFDELPQLINILKGEMSFVGPRPHVPEEVEQYREPWQRRRFSMLPGLTCYRQILRTQKIPFDEALALDLKYIEQWSLWADFFLMFKTIVLIFRRFKFYG